MKMVSDSEVVTWVTATKTNAFIRIGTKPSITLALTTTTQHREGEPMRNLRLTLAGLVTLATIGTVSLSAGVGASAAALPTLASCKTSIGADEFTKGKLTVATDTPAYTPWFVNNTASNGKGYESGVAYGIAKELGVKKSNVVWVHEPFNASFEPGNKHFDFDINEISYTNARAQVVTFSNSYYDVQQSIIALKGSKIVKDHTPAELKKYQYGDQIGTTGLAYIDQVIVPNKSPRVFNSLADAASALETHQIDAIVLDTPDGQYMASSGSGEVINSKKQNIAVQVGQFPSVGEHYGLLFQKGNKLVGCVNAAIAAMKSDGTLAKLQTKWLSIYTSVPVIKP
jgi:polar amino acid transport system substrate-binding protein